MAIAFAQVVEQARDQYMLGYVSSNEVPGTRPVMRKIDVKVRDKKMRVTTTELSAIPELTSAFIACQ